MNTQFNISLPWEDVKEKLLEAEPHLTEADLAFEQGNEDELLKRLAKKMGRTTEQVKGWIESVAFTDGLAG